MCHFLRFSKLTFDLDPQDVIVFRTRFFQIKKLFFKNDFNFFDCKSFGREVFLDCGTLVVSVLLTSGRFRSKFDSKSISF